MFTDRLIEKIKITGNPSVIGLDPRPEYIPEHLMAKCANDATSGDEAISAAFTEFNCRLIDALYDIIPCIKPQLACYEAYGLSGMSAFCKTVSYAKSRGLLVIADAKRNDIGSSAEGYAQGFISNTAFNCNAITINPYLGFDCIDPFVKACEPHNTGIFVLVKTSNPSGAQLQDLTLARGETIAEHLAALVNEWGKPVIGRYGYSAVGAVVGATWPEQAATLRKIMPATFFLVPGYGTQGGTAADVVPNFNIDGSGAIVNASRSIMLAYKSKSWRDSYSPDDFAAAARAEALRMRDDINNALDKGGRK